jgi:hypothetical protein
MRITAHEIAILDRVYMAVSFLRTFSGTGSQIFVAAYERLH